MRSLPHEARHERRVQAIRLRKAGQTHERIAAQTRLRRTGVFNICRRHEVGGAASLKEAPTGRKTGEKRLVSAAQEKAMRQFIVDKTPDQMKLPYAPWNRAAVARLIREEYPVIAANANAKAEGAEIHWGDETGLRSDDVRGRSYAPQGQTPVVRVNNKREGLSVISSVTSKGIMRWKIFDGALNADILIDFMKRLVRDARGKVYLILDNLRVHHGKPIKKWLAEHSHEIEVFYLPSYSPELNPNEMANAELKQTITKGAPTRTKLHLVRAEAGHLRSVQRQPERVKSYLQHERVRHAA